MWYRLSDGCTCGFFCAGVFSGVPVSNDEHLLQLSNGSLAIVDVRASDTGNYTCRAENRHGADEVVISLVIQGSCPCPTASVSRDVIL